MYIIVPVHADTPAWVYIQQLGSIAICCLLCYCHLMECTVKTPVGMCPWERIVPAIPACLHQGWSVYIRGEYPLRYPFFANILFIGGGRDFTGIHACACFNHCNRSQQLS